MWFRRKRKPIKVRLGDRAQISTRSGGVVFVLELTGISVGPEGASAIFTDDWRRYRADQ